MLRDLKATLQVPAAFLTGAFVLSTLVSGIYATWNHSATRTGSVTSGVNTFVAHPEGSATPDLGDPSTPDTTELSLPLAIAQALGRGEAAAFGIDVDARQEGHRGMSYRVRGVTATDLATKIDSLVYRIPTTTACTVDVDDETPGAARLHAGPLADFHQSDEQWHAVVDEAYGVGGDANANGADRLCIVLQPPADDSYENTATAVGSASNGATVSDTDTWGASVPSDLGDLTTPTALTFERKTYRAGE